MEKGFSLSVRFSERGAEWQEAKCASCAHYVLCPERDNLDRPDRDEIGQCCFGAALNCVAEGIEEPDVLEQLQEDCKYCELTVKEALHSGNCVHCKATLRFGDGPEMLALKNYRPRR